MPASNDFSARKGLYAVEFILGQHSLFVGALGQAFFYLRLCKPFLAVWVAGPFFMIPWAVVFVLFYSDRMPFPPAFVRRWWLISLSWFALLTIAAELLWRLGYLPPTASDHALASVIFVQLLMNLGWLSWIPLIHNYLRNSKLWS